MRTAPAIVAPPKVSSPDHVRDLDNAVTGMERRYGLPVGSTELLPNIESASGLMQTYDVAGSSPRITACLVASEDMAADLGAERTRDGEELACVRARFHLECIAAGVQSVDCPYTWSDPAGIDADTRYARRLGYTARSAVSAPHATIINKVMSPAPAESESARRIVTAFERARAAGADRVEVDGSLVELPTYMTAKRVLARARAYGVFAEPEDHELGSKLT